MSKIVAIIDWTHCIEDFIDNIGLSIEDFATRMTGGWLFGYIEALKIEGVNSVFFCFSSNFKKVTSFNHDPTGATIVVLPSPSIYQKIRKHIVNPYTNRLEEAGRFSGMKKIVGAFLLKVAPYCCTPLLSLRRQLKKYKCNAILCQEYENPRFDLCVLLGKTLGIPVFASFQGGNWHISPIEKYVRKYTLKKSAGLVIATRSEISRVRTKYGIPEYKIARIFNPLDLSLIKHCDQRSARTELGISDHLRIAIWHGRIDFHRKGLDRLLTAWDELNKYHPDNSFYLLLIGKGNNDGLLKKKIAETHLENIAWINEYINDRALIYKYLQAADVYVFPSRNEGFPVAPVEAMACGLPLLATDAPGIPDILEEGELNGGVVITANYEKLLAEKLFHFLTHPEYCCHMGNNARQHVEKYFSLKVVGQQLSEFIFK